MGLAINGNTHIEKDIDKQLQRVNGLDIATLYFLLHLCNKR